MPRLNLGRVSESCIYAVASDSEEGFWNNDDGWVADIEDATRWPGDYINSEGLDLPITAGNDARLIVTNY